MAESNDSARRARHGFSVDRPLCALTSPISRIGDVTEQIFGNVDCADCLRRSLAEAEERSRVLRVLLAKVEGHS